MHQCCQGCAEQLGEDVGCYFALFKAVSCPLCDCDRGVDVCARDVSDRVCCAENSEPVGQANEPEGCVRWPEGRKVVHHDDAPWPQESEEEGAVGLRRGCSSKFVQLAPPIAEASVYRGSF